MISISRRSLREGLAGITTPVTQQSRLDVFRRQWLGEQRVLLEVEHTQAEVEGGMEIAGELVDFILAQRLAGDSGASLVVDGPLGLAVDQGALGHVGRHCVDVE
jgi:hypothetical protein